jgi:hypothetical protein
MICSLSTVILSSKGTIGYTELLARDAPPSHEDVGEPWVATERASHVFPIERRSRPPADPNRYASQTSWRKPP